MVQIEDRIFVQQAWEKTLAGNAEIAKQLRSYLSKTGRKLGLGKVFVTEPVIDRGSIRLQINFFRPGVGTLGGYIAVSVGTPHEMSDSEAGVDINFMVVHMGKAPRFRKKSKPEEHTVLVETSRGVAIAPVPVESVALAIYSFIQDKATEKYLKAMQRPYSKWSRAA